VPRLDDAQGREQFAAEEIGAARVIGQGRQGIEDGEAARGPAIVALDGPEGHQVVRLDAILGLHLGEQSGMLVQQGASATDLTRGHPQVDVAGEGLHELRLAVVQLQHPLERLHVLERSQRRLADAEFTRLRAQVREPFLEALPRGFLCEERKTDCQAGQRYKQPIHGAMIKELAKVENPSRSRLC